MGRYITKGTDPCFDDSCATPNRFRLGTLDAPGTVWQCGECGRYWIVRYRLWAKYERLTGRELKRTLAAAVLDKGEPDER